MFRVFLKNQFSDKYLKELRKQIATYIPAGSRVIDIGCGTGALLFDLSHKISYGLGIDINSSMIRFAKKKSTRGYRNLEFKTIDANAFSSNEDYDIAVLTLVAHSLGRESGLNILKKSSSVAEKVIIADYIPVRRLDKLFICFDELLAEHYGNFREYMKNGIENLIKKAGLIIEENVKTKYAGIGIFVCRRK